MKIFDPTRYAKIKEYLWGAFLKVQNNSLKQSQIIISYKNNFRQRQKIQNKNIEGGSSFFNNKGVTCRKFGDKGHISPNLPKNNRK